MAKQNHRKSRQVPIGKRMFVDGVEREVFQDPDGRQYVWDDDEKVYGIWILLPDVEPDQPIAIRR